MDAAKAKKILFILRFLIGLCAALLVISLGTSMAHAFVKAGTYRSLTELSTATETNSRINAYLTAIRLEPGKPDAYIKLLDAYAQDGVLQKQESEEFLSIYNTYHNKIKKRTEGYGELHKQAGFLYINGYAEATTTSIRMALPFLNEALAYIPLDDPDRQTVLCYCRIGSYYQDYIWNAASVKEISQQIMSDLLTDIEGTLNFYHQQKDASVIYDCLGFSVAVCNLLYDQRDILAATTDRSRVVGILDSVYDNLPEKQSLQKERTMQLLETLNGNKANYYDMIQRAYDRKGAA